MDVYEFLYISVFLICIYLIYYFNDKMNPKFPKAYVKSDSQFYPINYNSTTIDLDENNYMTLLKSELLLYKLVIDNILEPFIKIIYYPKNILLKYI